MEKYLRTFGKIYNFMYDTHNEFTDIAETVLCEMGDDAMKNDHDFWDTARRFMNERGDALTSDREVAAFTATYMFVKKQEEFEKQGIIYTV